MSSGERRLHSFTVRDQILGELILEYCAMVVFLVFRADSTVKLNDIRVILGKELRTNDFNPYFHEQVAKKLESVKHYTVSYQKGSIPPGPHGYFGAAAGNKSNMLPSVVSKDATSNIVSTSNSLQNISNQTSDRSISYNNNIEMVTETNLVPLHKRAATERRIRGNRPSIAAVIHQKSNIITAALSSGREIDKLTQKYNMNKNMYQLNTARKDGILKSQNAKRGVMNSSGRRSTLGRSSIVARKVNSDGSNKVTFNKLMVGLNAKKFAV